MHATLPRLEQTQFPAIQRGKLETLQVNMGYRCNQQCVHCHVNAGPKRTENMNGETADQLIHFIQHSDIKKLDLTGGAPEMNGNFKRIVRAAHQKGIQIIDRCNLTILREPGFEWLGDFLAEHKVEVIASLPCYIKDNVDKQRGSGTFEASIEGLKQLNQLGYGKEATGLILNLMYNPQGPSLPPAQNELETAYKQHLKEEFSVEFNHLYTLTNMPIQRFGSMLISQDKFDDYMQLLHDNFKQENLDHVMCRSTISVDWQGLLYDCDFNQMLKLSAELTNSEHTHITQLADIQLEGKPIMVKDHCYGCTAGQGSSCGGAL